MSYDPQWNPNTPPEQRTTYIPAPPPPKKSKTPLVLLILAITLILVVGSCSAIFYAVGHNIQQSQTTPVHTAPAQPSDDPAEGTSTDEPEATEDSSGVDEPASLNAGESVDIEDSENDSTGTIKVGQAKNITSEYVMKGYDKAKTDHGAVWQIRVDLSVPKTSKGTFTINPYDFYWETKGGERYENQNGQALWFGKAEGLNNSVVQPGRKVTGVLKFDASKNLDGVYLVYAPNLGGETVAEWKLAS